ncbi:hypothetical protein [Paenibacillus jilunlii]|uniref:Uncharacterized protein n=2 Tax=Paenibacillus jilunlii TaxID=682956 RepID=A0A1G9PH21_9BACL|nr:hypothetical protein [Paenibacillus jilunlii]SDL98024.1 hypothetical protein SAMN05216191_107194 [Paenibacillus jilunlii]
MVVVIFLLLAWFCIAVMVSLPNKLPLAANFLLVMVIEVIVTNKLTVLTYNLKLIQINTSSIPRYLSMILENDVFVTFVLLTFANVFLTASKASTRWGISVYTFLVQMFVGAMLRWNSVLIYTGWNLFMEAVMIIALMIYTLLMGRLFQRMVSKEGWIR